MTSINAPIFSGHGRSDEISEVDISDPRGPSKSEYDFIEILSDDGYIHTNVEIALSTPAVCCDIFGPDDFPCSSI
jgi:hypothetical protein